MIPRVIFDKDSYGPGEIVRASFIIDDVQIPKRTRKITLALQSGERTTVTVKSGDSSRTYYEDSFYASEETSIDEFTSPSSIEHELIMTLPNEPIQPIITSQISVFHRALISFDVEFGSDSQFQIDIPYNYEISLLDPERIVIAQERITAEVNSDMGKAGDQLKVYLSSIDELEYRSIRVELKRITMRKAMGSRNSVTKRVTLAKAESMADFPLTVTLPTAELSSIKGRLFDVEYRIAFVIDIKFKQDINLEHEFNYIRSDDELCQFCGVSLLPSSQFCDNCGKSIEKTKMTSYIESGTYRGKLLYGFVTKEFAPQSYNNEVPWGVHLMVNRAKLIPIIILGTIIFQGIVFAIVFLLSR
ncbi:MAG: hypothetical protein ACXAD7_04845 [Candidatus Kariarchaeaceae archaeon]|jgi:hypothetical protein